MFIYFRSGKTIGVIFWEFSPRNSFFLGWDGIILMLNIANCWCKKWHPTLEFLPGKSHKQKSLVGYSPWGCRVGHTWVTEHTWELPQTVSSLLSDLLSYILKSFWEISNNLTDKIGSVIIFLKCKNSYFWIASF